MSDLSNWTPRKRPGLSVLEGRFSKVIPFSRQKHQDLLWDALGGHQTANELMTYFPNGPYERADEFGDWLGSMNENNSYQTMLFCDLNSDDVLGMASYMRIDQNNGVAEVGAVAHGPQMARSKIATEVHYLMAKHVFDDLGYRRYEWKLNNDNMPSHNAAQRYGFTFEGVFRQHIVAKGKNRDTAWYAMIDQDWPAIKFAMEAWLSDENFDENDLQIVRLEDMRKRIQLNK
ncbi:MAG: GNAT family protein [Lentilitoribacter sp.]